MDKNNAIKIVTAYLHRLLKNDFDIKAAYLFGSYARGQVYPSGDIDLAIVLNKHANPFEIEVKSMLRSADETIIELHQFDQADFTSSNPFAHEILKTGIEISLKFVF